MIGLDTNVIIRYLVQDDKEQSKRATRLIEKHCTKDSPGYVNCIVMAEIYWVLESCYKYTYDQIAYAMEALIKCPQLEIESIDAVWNAFNGYKKNQIDFSDALIGEINITKNCSKTVTLDKQASQLSTFSIL